MNKSLLLALSLSLVVFSASAQSCFRKNEKDKFTGEIYRETLAEKVFGTFTSTGMFRLVQEGPQLYVVFDFIVSAYSNFTPYKVNDGAQIMFLLSNDSVIKLSAKTAMSGTMSTTHGLPPVYTCTLSPIEYAITTDQFDQLCNNNVKSIRYYLVEQSGRETAFDNDIKPGNQYDIKYKAQCLKREMSEGR